MNETQADTHRPRINKVSTGSKLVPPRASARASGSLTDAMNDRKCEVGSASGALGAEEKVQVHPSGQAGLEGSTRKAGVARKAYVAVLKPAFDRSVGICLSLLLLPIMLAVAAAVRVKLGAGVLYTQERVGKGGKPFTLYKFRTMRPDRRNTRASRPPHGPDRRVCHKRIDDPRHTSLGRFLRKTSLDELPQFWNVALGHMSMVGPRPELVSVVEDKYEPWQHRRHSVKPGVTGLWQISARDESPMYLHTQLDLEYVEQIGLRYDLRILVGTIPSLVRRRGS